MMLNGHLLNERYRISKTIGGGGMANVYLARDIILDRDVAIKVLRLDYADDEEFIARFDREAQSATSLAHPNIINIYDVGEEDQILYMVMEYVDGMTLKEYIQRYGPIDVHEALDIMKQITSAIAHAHANDIVHRDIKPQNILIDTYGQAKVTDFGIAVALSATSLTQTNSILGSVHYLSPEQARGGMATKKSDVYSLGIVLFELLTGRLPFSGQSPVSIALKHLQNNTPSVKRFNPDVPQSVENIVLRATSKDPFHRYEAVYDMEEALEMALEPSRINEEKYTPPNEAGEETKAIPVITDNQLTNNSGGDTMVHQNNERTIPYENDENNEQAKNGKRKKSKKWLIFLIVLFTLLASGIAALFIIPNLLQPDDVEIPDVANMEYEEAMADLQNLNLKTDRKLTYSEDVEEGIVIETDPEAGSTVKEEDTVTIIVSQGKEKTAFDDYAGDDFNQTKQILEGKGYNNVSGEEVFSDQPAGEILSQTPDSGTELIPAEAEVEFNYSKGPEPIAVRNLQGMTEQDAIDNLREQGLSANIIEENSESAAKGEVIRQDPEPYTEMEKGDKVDVYISKGPEEKPPVQASRKFTVTYNPEQQSENPDKPVEQSVKIYIDDANRSISDVAESDTITTDKEYEITLTIPPNTVAEYQVIRDGEVVIKKTVSYEEGG